MSFKPRSVGLAIKRLFDILVCSVVFFVLLPILVIIALIIKFSSPGPVFFVQERVGMDGRIFKMLKFRTMTGAPRPGKKGWDEFEESRITPVGRFLRPYGIDELPQLINIIRGDMSIIGPRPPLPAQVKNFTGFERRMLRMRPGVTGLSVVRGRYSLSLDERWKYNVEYVDRWSLGLDLAVLLKTIIIVLTRQNATERQTRQKDKPEARV